MIVILATMHKKEMAVAIGRKLLEKRLIACYNLSPIESAFWWKGKIEEGSETLMILKSELNHFDAIEEVFMKESGYEVPELVAIYPEKVNIPYLQWVRDETAG
jgi:periplasmic divalent cation tolerance protein